MIYFIREKGKKGPVKIGYTSRDPLSRMAAMQTGCYFELEVWKVLRGERSDERSLHEKYSALRVRGEWFNYCPTMEDCSDFSGPLPIGDIDGAMPFHERVRVLMTEFGATEETAWATLELAGVLPPSFSRNTPALHVEVL